MARENGGVVADRLILGMSHHLHGNELRTEGHHVQLCSNTLVLLQNFRNYLPLDPPCLILDDLDPIGSSCHSYSKHK